MSLEKIGWLAKQAAQFVLPPKRTSSRTRTVRLVKEPDAAKALDDPTDNGSQSPHRYGRKNP